MVLLCSPAPFVPAALGGAASGFPAAAVASAAALAVTLLEIHPRADPTNAAAQPPCFCEGGYSVVLLTLNICSNKHGFEPGISHVCCFSCGNYSCAPRNIRETFCLLHVDGKSNASALQILLLLLLFYWWWWCCWHWVLRRKVWLHAETSEESAAGLSWHE